MSCENWHWLPRGMGKIPVSEIECHDLGLYSTPNCAHYLSASGYKPSFSENRSPTRGNVLSFLVIQTLLSKAECFWGKESGALKGKSIYCQDLLLLLPLKLTVPCFLPIFLIPGKYARAFSSGVNTTYLKLLPKLKVFSDWQAQLLLRIASLPI